MGLQSSREMYYHPPIAYLCKINQKAAFKLGYVSLFSLMFTATENMPQVRNTSLMSVSRHEQKRLFWSSVSGVDIKEQVRATVKESSYTFLFFFAIIYSLSCHSKSEVIFICGIM